MVRNDLKIYNHLYRNNLPCFQKWFKTLDLLPLSYKRLFASRDSFVNSLLNRDNREILSILKPMWFDCFYLYVYTHLFRKSMVHLYHWLVCPFYPFIMHPTTSWELRREEWRIAWNEVAAHAYVSYGRCACAFDALHGGVVVVIRLTTSVLFLSLKHYNDNYVN